MPFPAGIQADDIVLFASINESPNGITAPTEGGWTLFSGSDSKLQLWWYRATGSESSTFNVSKGSDNNATRLYMSIAYRGVVTTGTPVEAVSGEGAGTNSTPTSTEITTLGPDRVAINAYGIIGGQLTSTPPAGWDEEFEGTTGAGPADGTLVWDDKDIAAASVVSAVSRTLGGTPNFWRSRSFALIPAVTGGGTSHDGSLTIGISAAMERGVAWGAYAANQMAISAGQALAAGVDIARSLSVDVGAGQANEAGVDSNHSCSLSASAGLSQSAGAEIERALELLSSVGQAQSCAADFESDITLPIGVGQSQAGGSDLVGDLSLQAGASQAQSADAEIGGSLTLSSGVGLSTSTTAVFDGTASLGVSAGLSQGVQWIAETLATFASGVGESYSYGATQDASLSLGAGLGQSEGVSSILGASLTLSAQLDQAQTAQTDWTGEIALAAQLDDGRSVTGVFGAAVTLSGGAGQSQSAGLTQEAQLALGVALSDAMAAAIGQQSPTWQIITVPFENRTLTVAVELRTLKITR